MAYFLQHVPRKPMGHGIITDRETGQTEEHSTVMCAHCQMHWRFVPGSGHRRGWCLRCNGPTCGKKQCVTGCEPWEKAIERIEAAGRLTAAIERTRAL